MNLFTKNLFCQLANPVPMNEKCPHSPTFFFLLLSRRRRRQYRITFSPSSFVMAGFSLPLFFFFFFFFCVHLSNSNTFTLLMLPAIGAATH